MTALRSRWTHLLLLPILAVAAWLRFGRLATEHLHGDEAEYAIVARFLARDLSDLLYPALSGAADDPFVSQPPLVLYLMAFSMRVFGVSDVAAIGPSALLGVLTVAVVYALAWRLGGLLPALVASTLVAVLPFHVSMSRNAMLDVGYVFFALLAAFFLVAWLQERRRWHAVAAGVAGACACLAKLPGVLVVPVLALGVLAALALDLWRRDQLAAKRTFLDGVVMAAPILLGIALWFLLLLRLEAFDELWRKTVWNMGRVSGTGGGEKPLAYYFVDKHASLPAQLGQGVFALAIAGAGASLWRAAAGLRTKPERLVLPLLVLVFAGFFFLSARKIGFYLLPFAPLAALLIGDLTAGIRDLVSWAGIRYTRRDLRWIAPLVTAAALTVVAMPAYAAFDESREEYGPTRNGSTFGYGLREAAVWIDQQDPHAGQYGTLLGRFTLRWYNDHDTFHRFATPEDLDRAVEEGRLRYAVADTYTGPDEGLAGLLARHEARPAVRFEREWASVTVYDLKPDPPWFGDVPPWALP